MVKLSKPRAWLTGDVGDEAAALICRRFFVPDSPSFRESVNGALLELTHAYNWEQYGTLTEQQMADTMLVMYNRYMLDNLCSNEIPAPYWEASQDNEGGEAVDTGQSWYGIVTNEVWYEQISDWVLAGFLAISATPGAAIQYLTYVPRFRLAVRTHDLGAAVRIFLDGTEIFVDDTYSPTPGVKNFDVYADDISPGNSPHTIQVRQDTNSQLQVIRRELDPNELYPTTRRYSPGNDAVQQTYDGGATWVDDTVNDPRHSTVFKRPPRGAGDVRCDAAANMVQWLHDFIDAAIGLLQAVSLVTAVASKLLDFLGLLSEGFSVLFSIALDIAGTLSGIGAAALSVAFGATEYADLLCILNCNMAGDGSVSAEQLANIESEVTAQLNTTAAQVVNLILSIQGEIGLTNAGAIGSVVGDCSACATCAWCYTLSGAELYSAFDVYDPGFGVTGQWDATNQRWRQQIAPNGRSWVGIRALLLLPTATVVTEIQMHYGTTGSLNLDNTIKTIDYGDCWADYSTCPNHGVFQGTSGVSFPQCGLSVNPGVGAGEFEMTFSLNSNTNRNDCYIDKIIVSGVGVCPFGGGVPNC